MPFQSLRPEGSMAARKVRAACHRAWISMGVALPGGGGRVVGVHPGESEPGCKQGRSAGSMRMPLGVPADIRRSARWMTSTCGQGPVRRRALPGKNVFVRMAVDQVGAGRDKATRGASDVSRLPASVAGESCWAGCRALQMRPNCALMLRPGPRGSCPRQSVRARVKISESRPQSRNQGYPAITVTEKACGAPRSASRAFCGHGVFAGSGRGCLDGLMVPRMASAAPDLFGRCFRGCGQGQALSSALKGDSRYSPG